MALIYNTTMHPTKLELLAGWLTAQPWFAGDSAQIELIGAYRFDDPAGEVGMEGHLLTAGDDTVYHVPVTYRGAPLDVDDAALLGTSDHGVLGKRWVTDGLADPVYRAVLAETIVRGGSHADEVETDDPEVQPVDRPIRTLLHGSGHRTAPVPELGSADIMSDKMASRADAEFATLTLLRSPLASFAAGSALIPPRAEVLFARWPGQDSPVPLAALSAR